MKSFILRFLPVLLWMIVIFNLSASSDPYQAVLPSHWQSTCQRFLSSSNLASVLCQDDAVGNTSHVLEYTILAFLWVRALLSTNKPLTQNKRFLLFAIIFSLLYALSDETHQLFVPGRAFQLLDLSLDLSGSLLGVTLAWFILRNRSSSLIVPNS